MPEWSNQIPEDPRGVALPIRRAPAHGYLVAVVTSTDLVGTMTHFWNRRTMPHEKVNCEACKSGIPRRWHSYMSAWEPRQQMHFLFEVTAQAGQHFVTYRKAHGTLRGCIFKASRWRNIPNGRVLIECKPTDIVAHPVPEAPDLIKVLSILWNLPETQLGTDADVDDDVTKVVELIAQRRGHSLPPDPEKSNGRGRAAGQVDFP